jgi:DnaJ-class molecular chaperone
MIGSECPGIEIEPGIYSGCKPFKCPQCQGSGRINWWRAECPRCLGCGTLLDCPTCLPKDRPIVRSARFTTFWQPFTTYPNAF